MRIRPEQLQPHVAAATGVDEREALGRGSDFNGSSASAIQQGSRGNAREVVEAAQVTDAIRNGGCVAWLSC